MSFCPCTSKLDPGGMLSSVPAASKRITYWPDDCVRPGGTAWICMLDVPVSVKSSLPSPRKFRLIEATSSEDVSLRLVIG